LIGTIRNIDSVFSPLIGERYPDQHKGLFQEELSEQNGDSNTTSKIISDSLDLSNTFVERQQSTGKQNESSVTDNELSEEEQEVVKELQARDREVRAHEQAHIAAGGGLIRGGPNYTYQRGPDGKQYAIGGEVQIDNAPIAGDPEATIRKMRQVIRAALAPAEPSGQDQAVASAARSEISKATFEKMQASNEDNSGLNSSYAVNSNNKIKEAYRTVTPDLLGSNISYFI